MEITQERYNAAIRAAKSEAWEEGIEFYVDGYEDVTLILSRNPYREDK